MESKDEEKKPVEDMDALLAERERLDSLLDEKFRKELTVVFTDMKGSTAIAEAQGDINTRQLLKAHNDIVFAAIKDNQGTLVKSMGDGTLSHFENPRWALKAGIEIQQKVDEHNMKKNDRRSMIIVRVGIHSGKVIFEGNDIYGDVVNTASRLESSAQGGEIYLSESSYNQLDNKDEFYMRFVREQVFKGKTEPIKIYKAFWNEKEIDLDRKKPVGEAVEEEEQHSGKTFKYVALAIIIPVLLALALVYGGQLLNKAGSYEEKRSISHSVEGLTTE